MNTFRALKFAVVFLLAPICSKAADYYVAPGGDDSNPGTEALPWALIQYAASAMQPGDRVIVKPGSYLERVSTFRGGTSESNRITFEAEGLVTMQGFSITHPYITIKGFNITRHSSGDVNQGYLRLSSNADNVVLLDNVVRDGIFLLRTNFMFSSNTVTTADGGFIAAGFTAGQTIVPGRGSSTAIANTASRVIQSVTDTTLTVNSPFIDEGPVHAYLNASYAYGLVILSGAQNCVIKGNTFRNLSYDAWLVGGVSNLFENNTIEQGHGWDAMHFMGTDHVFRGNFIHSSPLVVYQVSPDVFENFPSVPYARVLFERNFVSGFAGILASQKGTAGAMNTLTFRNNVFMDVGRFISINPATTFENNTFLYVAATNSPVNSSARHALTFQGISEMAIVRNNIFVGCGQTGGLDERGWYEFITPPTNSVVSHNFVAGNPPTYSGKLFFPEGIPSLNGGDPGFVNVDDPLGPDQLPFTDDDGLRLRPDSKLRFAGSGGVDLGAYNTAIALMLTSNTNGTLRIEWPAPSENFQLQSAPEATGPWSLVADQPVRAGHFNVVTVTPTNQAFFYRLFQ